MSAAMSHRAWAALYFLRRSRRSNPPTCGRSSRRGIAPRMTRVGVRRRIGMTLVTGSTSSLICSEPATMTPTC